MWSGLPIFLIILSSFKEPATIFESPPKFIFKPVVRNYLVLARDWPEFFTDLVNSCIITIGAALLVVAVATTAGYVYSRYRARFFVVSAFFMLVIRMLPPIVITIPLFPLIHDLNLQDTHLLMIVLYSTFFVGLGSWIMKCFIDQIPREIEESAAIDGASTFQILRMIILPLSVHGMLVVLTFVVIFAWKEYLFASIFPSFKARTAPIIVSEMLGSVTGIQWGPLFAAAVIQLFPIFIFVLYAQKFLVKSLTIGAVKG